MRTGRAIVCAAFVSLASGAFMPARALPWIQFADSESNSLCDVVNAANLELVVLETGELTGITGPDAIFIDTFVDDEGFVFFQEFPAGFIEFAEDADGFRTLWWFTDFGDLVNVNEFTGEPTPTSIFPDEFADVPCNACPFWDEPAECEDSDGDGVEDIFDLCPFTPFDDIADIDGCSCSQIDADADGVIACDDFCPDTPLDEFADDFGCSCSQLDDDLDGVDNCFDLCFDTPADALVDIDGCAIRLRPAVQISFCGSFGAMIIGAMFFGLAGFRSRLRATI